MPRNTPVALMFLMALLLGCAGCRHDISSSARMYPLHTQITATVFWVGEPAGADNVANVQSAWDGPQQLG